MFLIDIRQHLVKRPPKSGNLFLILFRQRRMLQSPSSLIYLSGNPGNFLLCFPNPR